MSDLTVEYKIYKILHQWNITINNNSENITTLYSVYIDWFKRERV